VHLCCSISDALNAAAGLLQIPHPPNMTSMTAFGIYSGAKLSPLAGCILGFVIMVVTDALLGAHSTSACMTVFFFLFLPFRFPQFLPRMRSSETAHSNVTKFSNTIPRIELR
jgi:hypothetical protein